MVYIFLADGFEIVEALAPLDVLRRADIDVKLVGVTGEEVVASCGVTVKTDCLIEDVTLDDCEMLVLPGGGQGTENLRQSPLVKQLILSAEERGIMLGAICAAPTILAEAGLLRERRAVCYPSLEAELIRAGAIIPPDETVTHDRHIITARAAGSSLEFGLKLAAMLRGWAAAEKIRKAMYYSDGNRSLT
ncbi:thiazole biosynthesis protein ThiJ [Clostridia bacterium]|nr:thiazole biosynthesis protein ThiJ [Clostridia bacterium]